jgi:transcriptional regulator with XRE-family HTH domain
MIAHPLVAEMTRARTEHGVTHTGIHDTTGIARSTIRNWETGRRDPQLAMFDTYLRALGLRLAVVPLEQPADDTDDDPGEQIPFGELVTDPAEKFCRGCQQTRPRRDFYKDRSRRDGLTSRCKFCVTERVERNEARRAGLEAHNAGEGAA